MSSLIISLKNKLIFILKSRFLDTSESTGINIILRKEKLNLLNLKSLE